MLVEYCEQSVEVFVSTRKVNWYVLYYSNYENKWLP